MIFCTRTQNKGFSLLEVLIAMTIMMGSLTVIAMAWSGSQLRIKKMKMNYQSAFLLDYKVADVERFYKKKFTQIPDEDKGTFEALGKEYKNYTWKLVSKKFELPDLGPIINQQKTGTDTSFLSMMFEQLSEYFNQAVKEVTVTIIYTFGKNKVQYSATTFMIDFDRPLPMPGGGGAGAAGAGGTGAPGGGSDDN